jgi:hypothetical protein
MPPFPVDLGSHLRAGRWRIALENVEEYSLTAYRICDLSLSTGPPDPTRIAGLASTAWVKNRPIENDAIVARLFDYCGCRTLVGVPGGDFFGHRLPPFTKSGVHSARVDGYAAGSPLFWGLKG